MTDIKFLNILDADTELKEKVRLWRNKEDIRMSMIKRSIISKEEHSAWLENLKKEDNVKFWVIFAEGNPIGAVYLQNIDYEALVSEWGFYIGEDSYRGRGLGKTILRNLMKIFFDDMGFKSLITKVLSGNKIALKIYKEFNFKKIGRSPYDSREEILIFEFSYEDWMMPQRQNQGSSKESG